MPATIVVPEHAPATKLAAIERLGGTIVKVPYERWWQAILESRYDGVDGLFVHPVQDELVMAGNGTIGLELAEDYRRQMSCSCPGVAAGSSPESRAP